MTNSKEVSAPPVPNVEAESTQVSDSLVAGAKGKGKPKATTHTKIFRLAQLRVGDGSEAKSSEEIRDAGTIFQQDMTDKCPWFDVALSL